MPAACTWPRPTFGVLAAPTGWVDQRRRVAVRRIGGARWVFVGGDALQELVEVVAVEVQSNGSATWLAFLEGGQAGRYGGQVEKVVGVDHFSLHHGET